MSISSNSEFEVCDINIDSGSTESQDLEIKNDDNIWELYHYNNDHINYVHNNFIEIDKNTDEESFVMENNDPYSYFKLFITDELLSYIIEKTCIYQSHVLEKMKESNILMNSSRIKEWKGLTINELECYIGIVLWMSIHSNKDYKSNLKMI